jgi:chromatin segregation and condensation protein Rec8/ScpA/Scc1 (kleisin family)
MEFSAILKTGPREIRWIAAMFVAILELARLGEIDLVQSESFGEISIEKKAVAV